MFEIQKKVSMSLLKCCSLAPNIDRPALMLFSVSEVLDHMQKYHYLFLFGMLLYNFSLARAVDLFSLAFKLPTPVDICSVWL